MCLPTGSLGQHRMSQAAGLQALVRGGGSWELQSQPQPGEPVLASPGKKAELGPFFIPAQLADPYEMSCPLLISFVFYHDDVLMKQYL